MSVIKRKIINALTNIELFNNEHKDPNKNRIFFKKYKIVKLIYKSKFSYIYEGINLNTKEKIAIKLENKNKNNILEKEAYTLFTIKGFGIVELISFGKNKENNIMIQPLLGDSLYKFFIDNNKNFNIIDICLIGIQCLERIEWIHKNNIIHRDIKPENFLFGLKDPRIIYLIDFGLSKQYRSKRTFKHINHCYTKKILGTLRYASVNSLRGYEMSRRDDLESFIYMIMFFIMKKLPWQDIKGKTKVETCLKILEMKSTFNIDDYKIIFPNEIIKIFKYIKRLKFEEEPNYSFIKNLFKSILYNNGHEENEIFSWLNNIYFLNQKKSINLSLRKSSVKKRILDKLNKSIKKQTPVIKLSTNSLNNMKENINLDNKEINSHNFYNLKKSNYELYTQHFNKNNCKNYYLSTPENKISLSINNNNRTTLNESPILKNGVFKNLKIKSNKCLNHRKINGEINDKLKFDSEGVNNILKTNDLKINRNGVKKAIFLQNKNNNTYNSENDFYKYNNYLNNSQKYEKLNNMKNKIKFIQSSNEIIHKKIINRKIDFNKLNINQKSFVNKMSDINQINKFLLFKNNGIIRKNEKPKFVVNNTFINNYSIKL